MQTRLFKNCFFRFATATQSQPVRLPTLSQAVLERVGQQQIKSAYEELMGIGIRKPLITRLLSYTSPDFKRNAQGELPIKKRIQELPVPKSIQERVLLALPHVIRNPKLYLNTVELLKNKLKLTEEEQHSVIERFPKIIDIRVEQNIDHTLRSLQGYTHIQTLEELGRLLVQIPFLININNTHFTEGLKFFDFIGQKDPHVIIKALKQFPAIFVIGRNRLHLSLDVPKKWGISQEETFKVLREAPEYMILRPELLHLKIKILRHFGVSLHTAREMFLNHTNSFLLSVSSLEAKLIFLRDKFRFDFSKHENSILPYLLSLNYNGLLRPRGELLLKLKMPLEKRQFQMSEEEFLKTNNISRDIYDQQVNRYKRTAEKDREILFFNEQEVRKETQQLKKSASTE